MVNVVRLLAVFASFFLSLNLFAQEQCGTDEMIVRNPFLMSAYNNRVACEAPEIDLDTAQVLTIPVVVHVLHLGEVVGEISVRGKKHPVYDQIKIYGLTGATASSLLQQEESAL